MWEFIIEKGLLEPKKINMENNPLIEVEKLSVDPKGKLVTTWAELKVGK